jgi:hypothetical protein
VWSAGQPRPHISVSSLLTPQSTQLPGISRGTLLSLSTRRQCWASGTQILPEEVLRWVPGLCRPTAGKYLIFPGTTCYCRARDPTFGIVTISWAQIQNRVYLPCLRLLVNVVLIINVLCGLLLDNTPTIYLIIGASLSWTLLVTARRQQEQQHVIKLPEYLGT